MFSKACTCGSGAHPRYCDVHPGAYQKHIKLLNYESRVETLVEETIVPFIDGDGNIKSEKLKVMISAIAGAITDNRDKLDVD